MIVADLNLMLGHEKHEVEKLAQEQKSWLSRGVTAEFEKKEKVATFTAQLNYY